nr:uncharacterized protein CG45076-like [Aegilops tauschii subsp. strangulata]
MKASAVTKAAKATVAKWKATASSSSKRYRTPSPSPSGSTLEAEFDLRSFRPARKRKLAEEEVEEEDMETLAQRVAKRAKASTSDKAPAERQQQEPPRATPNTPPLSTMPPRGASPARASTTKPMHMEEGEVNLGAGGSAPATNAGGEGATSSQPAVEPSSAARGDIDTVIEEVARDAEAEADKIATEEAAKTTAEEAAKGPAGEAGKADVEKAQEAAKEQAAKDEAARHQYQAELNY